MTRSPAAQEASRRNGAKSKGPKTAKGKQRSARNAVKHNMRGRAVLDCENLPGWLREIERELVTLLGGNITLSRREWMDQMLLAWLQLDRVDALIENTGKELFAGMEPNGEGQVPAFLDDEPEDALAKLSRLHAYRRRFRGRRDACVRRLFRQGMPQLDKWDDEPGEEVFGKG